MKHNRYRDWKYLVAVLTAGLLALSLFTFPGALAELPPRPDVPGCPEDPTPEPDADESLPAGILLRATFPADWPWTHVHWQTPLTVVQWQDGEGAWHDVEGWRAPLALIVSGPADTLIGWRPWGVDPKDFGSGPFRWVVYADSSKEDVLATSSAFDLPRGSEETRVIDVMLEHD